MKYIRNTSVDPHYNMAFDEFCLQGMDLDDAVFYLWRNRPSVIIGLNQNAYGEVNLPYIESRGIALARRVTGGGAVYHDLQNVNYTIVGPSENLDRDYSGYMHYMLEALRSLGVPAEISGRNDILVEGRKVSGYAKRVWHNRLMIHGTIMYDVDIEELTRALSVPGSKLSSAGIASVRSRVANLKDYLPGIRSAEALMGELERILSRSYADPEVMLTEEQKAAVSREADGRFRTWEWNYGRSRQATFSSSRKFSCGTVEVEFSLERGFIQTFRFGGDFLGNLAADVIATALEGTRFDYASVLEKLKRQDVGLYFDNLSPEELADLIVGSVI